METKSEENAAQEMKNTQVDQDKIRKEVDALMQELCSEYLNYKQLKSS